MQRNPSHFGSYNQPSPSGISSASLASIGASGGCSGKDIDSILPPPSARELAGAGGRLTFIGAEGRRRGRAT